MARTRTTQIPGYYRGGHHVSAHKRRLSEPLMFLELAENGSDDDITGDIEFLLIPDPLNKRKPIYVREDAIYSLTDPNFNRLIDFSMNFNPADKIARIQTRRKIYRRSVGLNEDETGGESGSSVDWDQVVDIVDSVLDLFDSGSGSGSGQAPCTGSYVNADGMVFCIRNINGQDVGFGLDPSGRRLIALSSPQNVTTLFPNLVSCAGTGIPFIQLPSVVPAGLISLALRNPDKVVRIKPGTNNEFEVMGTPFVTGTDPDGNPIVTNPDGSGGSHDETTQPKSLAGLLPIALIGSLLFMGK